VFWASGSFTETMKAPVLSCGCLRTPLKEGCISAGSKPLPDGIAAAIAAK